MKTATKIDNLHKIEVKEGLFFNILSLYIKKQKIRTLQIALSTTLMRLQTDSRQPSYAKTKTDNIHH